jgi:hypothetical protein
VEEEHAGVQGCRWGWLSKGGAPHAARLRGAATLHTLTRSSRTYTAGNAAFNAEHQAR